VSFGPFPQKFETKALTISALADGTVALTYGAEEPAHLDLTIEEGHGTTRKVIFEAAALKQFAHMFRELDKRFPGAFRGH
jgi:hypothetical protein